MIRQLNIAIAIKRWQALGLREKYIMIIGAMLMTILLLYVLCWLPLLTYVSNLREQVMREEKVNASLFLLDKQIQLLKKKPGDRKIRLRSALDNIKKSPFANHVSILTTMSNDNIHCQLKDVNFDQLMTWLIPFTEQESLIIEEADFQRMNNHGLVRGEIVLR